MVFTTEQIGEIKSKAIVATKQLRVEYAPIEEQLKKKGEAAKALTIGREQNPPTKEILVGEAISEIPVCNDGKAAIAKLIKVITGMDISVPVSVEDNEKIVKDHIPLSMVVPTKNENGHNYPLNIPILMVSGIRGEDCDRDLGIRASGEQGNHLEWDNSGLRPATDDEIGMFFKAWEALAEMGVPLCESYDILGIEKKDGDE